MDEEPPKPKSAHVIGADLSRFSVTELRELAAALEEERARVETAAEEKERSRTDAQSVFKS